MRWEFQQFEPTPARGKFSEDLFSNPEFAAEWKLDGDRRIGQFMGDSVRFTGRRTSDVTGLLVEKSEQVPHLSQRSPSALEGTVLDGEFLVPGGSKRVTSIMGSLPERAIQLQMERGWIQYMVFDCLFYQGVDLRGRHLYERQEFIGKALRLWDNPHVFQVESVSVSKKNFLEQVWAEGGEGVVLKHLGSLYAQKHLWVKVKRELTQDVVIIGYEDAKAESEKVSGVVSETKYHALGLIGAVAFGQYRDGVLVPCGKCSGMDDSIRQLLSENKEKFLNTVVEIKANDREPTGKFRHPRFLRFRPDRDPTSCVWVPE